MPYFPASEIWPWFILMAGLAAGLSGFRTTALGLLGGSAAAALALGFLSLAAAVLAAGGLVLAAALPGLAGWWNRGGHILLTCWCVAMAAHLIPGFENPRLLDAVQAGAGSSSFTLHLNLDKPLVFFALLLAWPGLASSGQPIRRGPFAAGLLLLPALFALTLMTSAIAWQPGLPEWWLVFALSNLFLTCIAEEAFFRGYLQSALCRRMPPAFALGIASLVFGLVHLPGGVALAGFAAILGLACGLGYWATGRLWVAVAMHFSFNFIHLALFTYPSAAG